MKLKSILSNIVLVSVISVIHSCDGYSPIDNNPIIKAGSTDNCEFIEISPDIEFVKVLGYEDVKDELTIDLDKDGTDDLKFKFDGYYGRHVDRYEFEVEPIRPDFYLSITEGALSRAYYEGEEIKCDDYYSDDNLTLITYEKENLSAEQEPKRTGNWLDVDKKYLCFKFLISDIWHIGWIQIGFPNEDNKLVIYKYAYSNVPGLCVD